MCGGGLGMMLFWCEFEFLFKFVGYLNKMFLREYLIEDIWGFDYEGDEWMVDVYIKRLREWFFEKDYLFVIYMVWGFGYWFVVIE